jgi:hypothetical protein
MNAAMTIANRQDDHETHSNFEYNFERSKNCSLESLVLLKRENEISKRCAWCIQIEMEFAEYERQCDAGGRDVSSLAAAIY